MDRDARKELTTLRLREKAAEFAKETVKIQMKSFKVITYSSLFSPSFIILMQLRLSAVVEAESFAIMKC